MGGRDNGEVPPRPDLSRKYTVEEAKDLAIGWADYWVNHPTKPHGFQLLRSAVTEEGVADGAFGGGEWYRCYDDEKGKGLVDRALEGDLVADAALCNLAAKRLEVGSDLPPNLKRFIVIALRSRAGACPPRKKGGDPYANVARDMFIVGALSLLDRMGFSPTKNEATDKPTGSSILAEALQKLGFDIDYAGVAKVWRRRDIVDTVAARHPSKSR